MRPSQINSLSLLSGVTIVSTGIAQRLYGTKHTFHASGYTSSGSGSATIVVEVSNNGTDWVQAGSITLTLSSSTSGDGFTKDAPWKWVRGKVSAISGTGATVALDMGVPD